MQIKKIISLLGAATLAASLGAAGVYAESGYDRYTAAYDDDGRLVAAYKTEDVNPAENTLNFKYLKSFIWDGKNAPYTGDNAVEFDAEMYGTVKMASDGYRIKVYNDEIKRNYSVYTISESAAMYVNGVEVDGGVASSVEELFKGRYILGNTIGSVRLSETGTPDGIYDIINVSYYVDGVVASVEKEGNETYILFDEYDYSMIDRGEIALDDTVEYSIKLDGAEITTEEIMPGDVLSIAYDVTNRFRDSDTYDIYVSRNRHTVRINSVYMDRDPLYDEYTGNDGNIYKLAYEDAAWLSVGVTYDLYLNVDGRIAGADVGNQYEPDEPDEPDEPSIILPYGLLENVYMTNGNSDAYADIITSSGVRTAYPIRMDDLDRFVNILMEDMNEFYSDDKLVFRKRPQERVISYAISSNGELRLLNVEECGVIDGEFSKTDFTLGGVPLSPEYTSILDVSEYNMYKSNAQFTAINTDYLTEKAQYKGYAFGADAEGAYQFVLIYGVYGEINDWGVFVNYSTAMTDNGVCDAIDAYVNQQLVTLPTDGTFRQTMSPGDLFFYHMNSDGEIDELMMIAQMESNYWNYYGRVIDSDFNIINRYTAMEADGYELVSGAITDVSGYSIKLATEQSLAKSYQSMTSFVLDDAEEYDFAQDMNVYVYDYSISRARNRVSVGAKFNIRNSRFDRDSYVGDRFDGIVDFEAEYNLILSSANANYGNVNFAVAKVVDREITEILVIIPDYEEE